MNLHINLSENPKITFFNLVTLTFELQTPPRYCQGQPLHQIFGLYVKQFSRESTDRQTDVHTDRCTDRTDFIPSTADMGGKNLDNDSIARTTTARTQNLLPGTYNLPICAGSKLSKFATNIYQGKQSILSHAGEMGSPTNHPGLQAATRHGARDPLVRNNCPKILKRR